MHLPWPGMQGAGMYGIVTLRTLQLNLLKLMYYLGQAYVQKVWHN